MGTKPRTTSKNGLVQSTLVITFCSILGILIGFVSQLIIANYFGAKFERDAYFVASTIPTYLSAIFTGSVGVAFLPKIVALKKEKERELTNFLRSLLAMVLIVSVILVLLCTFFSKIILGFVASGFDSNQIHFTSKILTIILPTFVLGVITNLLSSLYQIKNRFFYPALAPVLSSAISLIFVLLFSKSMGIFALAWGFLIGTALSTVFLLPALRTFKLGFSMNVGSKELIPFVRTFMPLLLTGILFRSTSIFERTIASGLEQGSISYLGYASQILMIMATLTANGIGVSIYPTMSKLWSDNNSSLFVAFFAKVVRIILLISIPISFVIGMWGSDFIRIVFERGAFDHYVTLAVGKALAWSMGAFVFQSLGNVVTKVFYISTRTVSISIIASIELLLYISLGYLLSGHFSFVGLSIALSISSAANILLSITYIEKRIIRLDLKKIGRDFTKILISSLLALSISYIAYHAIPGLSGFAYLIGCLILGGVFLFYVGLKLKIEEFVYFKRQIETRIAHKNHL